jgi:hypothetical protein
MPSAEEVEALLGPNGYVLFDTLPSACWWFLAMAAVLVVASFSLGNSPRDQPHKGGVNCHVNMIYCH